MKKKEIDHLSDGDVLKKWKSNRALFILFIPLILLLLFFLVREYILEDSFNMNSFVIFLCTIGGLVSVWPDFRLFSEEKRRRNL